MMKDKINDFIRNYNSINKRINNNEKLYKDDILFILNECFFILDNFELNKTNLLKIELANNLKAIKKYIEE